MAIRSQASRIRTGAMVALLVALAAGTTASAQGKFEEAELFFELNNTDGDLGIHAVIDGAP